MSQNLNNSVVTYPSFPSPSFSLTGSPTKAKLAAALVKTQLGMGDATKGAKNSFFKSNYADLNAIREVVLPAANANGIAVLQPTVYIGEKAYVRTYVIHESGEEMFADTEIVVAAAKILDPQAHGSGISYARRYGLQAFFNVGAADDDGEKAVPASSRAPAKSPEKSVAAASPATPSQAIVGAGTGNLGQATSGPVTSPGTESVVAATEATKKSTSFRSKKNTEVSAPAVVAVAPASEDQDWS